MKHYSIGKIATIACLYFACAGSCASKELHEADYPTMKYLKAVPFGSGLQLFKNQSTEIRSMVSISINYNI